jgi:hypothetical protein
MRLRTVAVFSILITASAIILVTMVYPPIDDLNVKNLEWNGLSQMYRLVKPLRVDDFSELTTIDSGSTLFIIGPIRQYTDDDAQAAEDYLSRGGKMVVMDDFGSANTLLVRLGLDASFTGKLLADPLFKDKNHLLPRIRTEGSGGLGGVITIELNYPTTISNTEGTNIHASSSRFSYLAESPADDGTNKPSEPYPVIVSIRFGAGEVVLVSDSSVFINGMIERADNKMLLEELVSGAVFVDESHLEPTRLTAFNQFFTWFYWALGRVEFRYGLLLLVGLLVFKVDWTEKDINEGIRDELEAVLKAHPEADRRVLERLDDSRRKKIGPKRRPR